MPTERRRQLLLAAVVLALAGAIYYVWPATPSVDASPSSNKSRQTPAKTGQSGPAAVAAPDVHLAELDEERAKPGTIERNLFRFKTKPPPAPPPTPPRSTAPAVAVPVTPSGPAPPPPIALKFIGIVEVTAKAQKIAILSDGRNAPFYGREGDIIEGRYRILKIGVESVELAYVDGRGRQTIRLTGG